MLKARNDRLAQVLYLLARDHLPVGVISDVVNKTSVGEASYSLSGVGHWACELSAEIGKDPMPDCDDPNIAWAGLL